MTAVRDFDGRRKEPLRPDDWESRYRAVGNGRLWPESPIIQGLDFEALLASGVLVVLDAACGDGRNLAHLARAGFFAIGVDGSGLALKQCAQFLADMGVADRCLLLSPSALDRLPFVEEAVAAVVCTDVLGHLQDVEPVRCEIARILRPGGFLYANLWHIDDGCRAGPRLEPTGGHWEYWYTPSRPDPTDPQQGYFYRFYDDAAARAFFSRPPFRLLDLERRTWEEAPHPGFREEPHTHVSLFGLAQKA
jgi:SAM-dependent methyltransferase